MIDYIINDNHGSIGQCCLSDCRTLLNIVVLTTRELDNFVFNNKELDIFVFNDNSDNGRQ